MFRYYKVNFWLSFIDDFQICESEQEEMKENGFYFKDEENIWLGLKSNNEDLLV